MSLALLTASRLRTARACRRLHFYRYGLGIRSAVDQVNLRFGTLMHRALELWWKGWQLPEEQRLTVALAAIKAEDPYEAAKARVMMIGYHLRWSAELEYFEVLGVEVKFEVELRNPATGAASRTWRLAGKVDVLVRDIRTRQKRLIEHKTSAEDLSPGSNYFKRLRIDGQVSVYFEGARSLGHDVADCIYDVLGKPSHRPLKATPEESRKYTKGGQLYAAQRDRDETPEEYEARIGAAVAEAPEKYFVRVEVVRLEEEMKDALLDVWQLGQELREAELAGRKPKNPEHCITIFGTCSFFPVCTGEASLDDTTLFQRIEDVHPELSQEAVQ